MAGVVFSKNFLYAGYISKVRREVTEKSPKMTGIVTPSIIADFERSEVIVSSYEGDVETKSFSTFSQHHVEGELAALIREHFNAPQDRPVFITNETQTTQSTEEVSGEEDEELESSEHSLTIECGNDKQEFKGLSYSATLASLFIGLGLSYA